jgi:TonB family protein
MFKTKHEKKAFIEATVVMAILVALMFIAGLKYLDPPPPGNIAVNFGFSDKGSGKIQPENPEKAVKQAAPEPVKTQKEKILTQNTEEAPVIKSSKTKKNKTKKTKPVKSPPKPSKETSEVLENIFNAPEGNQNSSSEGDDAVASGDKGNPGGDKNSKNYYGTGGSGGGDPNYRLGNRRAVTKPKPQYRCNESGRVVVIITVDRAGNVIKAEKGKGTTAAACLTKAAIEAAKKTKWESDPGAPPRQIGKIIYNFKLTE